MRRPDGQSSKMPAGPAKSRLQMYRARTHDQHRPYSARSAVACKCMRLLIHASDGAAPGFLRGAAARGCESASATECSAAKARTSADKIGHEISGCCPLLRHRQHGDQSSRGGGGNQPAPPKRRRCSAPPSRSDLAPSRAQVLSRPPGWPGTLVGGVALAAGRPATPREAGRRRPSGVVSPRASVRGGGGSQTCLLYT